MNESNEAIEVNRALWDERARLHGQDAVYDVEGFLRGDSALLDREIQQVTAAVGSVENIDLLHIQCHFGLSTLSWARLGANVTGVDFSPVAIERARDLAKQAGLQAEFVEADAQHLPSHLENWFDVAFASYGVVTWIEDLDAWMRSAFRSLRPGGKFVIVEVHPVFAMFDSREPLVIDFPYGGGEQRRFDESGSYADPDLDTSANVSAQFAYGLGDVVNAAIRAGFVIDDLTEYLDEIMDPRGNVLRRNAEGAYVLPLGDELLPVTYSLRASRPG